MPPVAPPSAPSEKVSLSLDGGSLQACVRAFGFSDCTADRLGAGASVLIEPVLGASSEPRLLLHAIDAVAPQLTLKLGLGIMGGATISLFSGTTFAVRRNVSNILSTSDASPLDGAGSFLVSGQAGTLQGELSVTGYGFASASVPTSPQQTIVLSGEANTRGNLTRSAHSTSSDFAIRTTMQTAMVRDGSLIEVDIVLTGSFIAPAPPSPPPYPPSVPRITPAPPPPPRPPPPHSPNCANVGGALRCPPPPLVPCPPALPPPLPPPPPPPPPSAPPGELVEAPQQIPVEQAFFTFRPAPTSARASAGVFTPDALREMLALYLAVVEHPRFEQFCLLGRSVPGAPLTCEPPRSPLQLFYGRNTSRFGLTDFLAFDLPRFENMSSLIAAVGIGPLVFADLAGADPLLDGCQAACAPANATQCELTRVLSTLPSHVKLNGGLAAGKSGGGGVLTTDMIDSLGPCAPYRELLRSGFRRPWIARVLQLHLHLARLSVRRARPSAPALPSPHVSHRPAPQPPRLPRHLLSQPMFQ